MSGTILLSMAAVVSLAAAAGVAVPAPRGRLGMDAAATRRGFLGLLQRRFNPKTPRDGPGTRHRIASDIELFAACYRAGLPAATAADAVVASYDGTPLGDNTTADRWRRVVAYLSLGVEPDRAWAVMDGTPGLEQLATTPKPHTPNAAMTPHRRMSVPPRPGRCCVGTSPFCPENTSDKPSHVTW